MVKVIFAGASSLMIALLLSAPVLAAPTAKMQKTTDKVCAKLEQRVTEPALQKPKNQPKLAKLTQRIDNLCPAQATVTISADGCTVTATAPEGSVLTYGAYTPDHMRGFDAEPTIFPASGTVVVSTGAAKGMISYGTVTDSAGKQLATKTAAVTANVCPTDLPNGGYPAFWANAPIDSQLDSWGMYNRESVSYSAFRVADSGRHMPYWGGQGNANQWAANATAAGIPVDTTPQAGDVAIRNVIPFGFSMYVEGVNPDGTINVSYYNLNLDGNYGTRSNMTTAGLTFIHFP